MKSNSLRVRVLLGLVAVLGMAFGVDSVIKSRAEAQDSTSARARYMDRAKIVSSKRELVARSAEWTKALEGACAAWAQVEPTLVRAPTTSLAEEGFRDEVLAAATSFDLPANRIAATRSEPIAGAPGMHLLEVRLEVESNLVPDVLRLVDRLENMPNRPTGIAEIRLEGPGLNSAKEGLGATIVVQSIGYVASANGGGGAP